MTQRLRTRTARDLIISVVPEEGEDPGASSPVALDEAAVRGYRGVSRFSDGAVSAALDAAVSRRFFAADIHQPVIGPRAAAGLFPPVI